MATGGVPKVLEKIKGTVESGAYYEAQQMYKTVYHRYRARKLLQDSYHILKEGAIQQFQKRQVTCGVELGLLLIDAFVQDTVPAEGDAEDSVMDMISSFQPSSSMPAGESSASTSTSGTEELSRLVASAIKWAQGQGQLECGRRLHDKYAGYLWKLYGAKGLGRAALHFVRGSDATLFAEVLKQCSAELPTEELDLLLCRSVLQALAVASKNSLSTQLGYAQVLFHTSSALHAELDTPLMNFTRFLLQALEARSLQLVRLLTDKYQPSLARDPCFEAYLTKVERMYFNTSSGAGSFGGLLGSLLKGLTDFDEDEDDE